MDVDKGDRLSKEAIPLTEDAGVIVSTRDVDRLGFDDSPSEGQETGPITEYKVYRRRWIGCLGMFLLNVSSGMNGMWFSAIAIETAQQFDITLAQVNWLSNSVNLIYLPTSLLIPSFVRRYGVRYSCFIGAAGLFIACWLKFSGTAKSLSPQGAYALLFIGQLFAGLGQPWFQVLGPKYSERWFDVNQRTTVTMVMAIGNPIGCALGQLLPPLIGTPRESLLILAIISTVFTPLVLLIGDKPPNPPTYSGSKESPPSIDTLRAILGLKTTDAAAMSFRERIDFVVILLGFGVLVASITAFGNLISQVLVPYGYTSDQSGIIGAVLLLSGLVGAIATAPLFDRVFTHHLGLTLKVLVPPISACWIAMIWAVKSNGLPGIYVTVVLIGFASFTLLPVSLELACEITRNPAASSAALWFTANLITFIYVIIADPLRAGADGNPPGNLRSYLILQACVAASLMFLIVFLNGKQVRREMDMRLGHANANAK